MELIKKVTKFGNASHVTLPAAWVGHDVKIVYTDVYTHKHDVYTQKASNTQDVYTEEGLTDEEKEANRLISSSSGALKEYYIGLAKKQNLKIII